MNTVNFPLINLNLEIEKTAITIFGISIHWYAVLIVIGIVIALLLCKKDSGKYNIKFETILDISLYVIPISIISARLYYVIFSPETYIANPLKIFDLRTGGLAIYGGIIGAVITIIVYCKKKKINCLDVFDYLAPFLPLAQSIGRWGNFLNIEAYGVETNLPWRMGLFENGIYKEVHPTFLYESIATFIIFIILYGCRNKRQFKGEFVTKYLIMYSFVRFFIEGLRIDSLMFFDVRISQLLSLAIFVVFCTILYRKQRNTKNIVNNRQNM